MGPWARVRLVRDGQITDLVVLNASLQGVAFLFPKEIPTVPRPGQTLQLLLDSRSSLDPVAVRADVLDVMTDVRGVSLVCVFRPGDTSADPQPIPVKLGHDRRQAFRVFPKPSERIPVTITAGGTHIDGSVVDFSSDGMRIATNSESVHEVQANQKFRLSLTIPGLEAPVEVDCVVTRTVTDRKPYFCALLFKPSERNSEFERAIVTYVRRRQREIIQLRQGRGS